MVRIGDGVKIFLPPDFGRQDAIVFGLRGTGQTVDAKIVRTNQLVTGLLHRDQVNDDVSPYWVELPVGFIPGSEGH